MHLLHCFFIALLSYNLCYTMDDVHAHTFYQELFSTIDQTASELQVSHIEALIKAGARIEARNADNNTPLLLAAERGNIAIMGCLMRHGADLTVINNLGFNLLCQAVLSNNRHAINFIDAIRGTSGKKVFDIENRAEGGMTPLMVAVYFGRFQAANRMIELGADVETAHQEHDNQRTAVMEALVERNIPIAVLLIRAGAHVDDHVIHHDERTRDVERFRIDQDHDFVAPKLFRARADYLRNRRLRFLKLFTLLPLKLPYLICVIGEYDNAVPLREWPAVIPHTANRRIDSISIGPSRSVLAEAEERAHYEARLREAQAEHIETRWVKALAHLWQVRPRVDFSILL